MRKALPHKNTAEQCLACTTPVRCAAVAWHTKGLQCIGHAAGPDLCDCLNECGDDPWLKDGRAVACAKNQGAMA